MAPLRSVIMSFLYPLQVIGKANEILAGVSHPSVCSEVLLSKPGTAYILGMESKDLCI